jgi:hypothetical protein
LEGYYITLAKPKRKAIPISFCDNIINHEQKDFLKILDHYIIPNILIQVNESIEKFFTLMVECPLEQSYVV